MTIMMEGMEMEGMEMEGMEMEGMEMVYLPMSSEVFFAISVELPVAFSIIEVIPNLSTPFLIPSKNVFQPKPSIARKNTITNMINIIRDSIPIIGYHKCSHNPFNDYTICLDW
jgi:hypothetical protein